MKARMSLVVLVTIGFLVVAGIFEVLHWQANLEPVTVAPDQLRTFDGTLRNDFISELNTRKNNQLGTDLGY